MNILIVGNIIKDVYLNLDSRTENFETDKENIKWLNLRFNASEHFFFNRNSSLGGAAVSLETLRKLNLEASVLGANLSVKQGDLFSDSPVYTHRYILTSDNGVCYFAPTEQSVTIFEPPEKTYDYLYIDRSANLDQESVEKIATYLNKTPKTKLIIFYGRENGPKLNSLLSRGSLIFSEIQTSPELDNLDLAKLIFISEKELSYLDISERVNVSRVNMMTHLSTYSIASATILGCFIIGYSVEESLRLARLNMENSKLNSVLSLSKLQELSSRPSPRESLELTAANLVLPGKGILAADESGGSIHKKFDQLDIPDTYENRRDYRNIFFTTPDLEQYVNGVILFDETAHQTADNGQNFTDFLISRRIIPGIKVDQGLKEFGESDKKVLPEEVYTEGLENLPSRLAKYYQMGLRFAKWRAAFNLKLDDEGDIITPSNYAIEENCRILAEYAKACQTANIVPIVEPELVYDGYYDIDQATRTTAKILDCLFEKLAASKINLRACILKCNMVLAGKQYEKQSTPTEVGENTAKVLKEHVPEELAGVVFLSGGQTPEQATDNLAAITKQGPFPWPVTFSFARALQDSALYAWKGNNANTDSAQTAFTERLKANQLALSN